MDAINQLLMPWWNLPPSAPPALALLARLASDSLPWAAAAAVAALVLAGGPWRVAARHMLLAMALAWLLARGLQAAWPMPRPAALGLGTQWMPHGHSSTWPSMHATVAAALGAAALLTAPRRWLALAGLGLAAAVAWSRVALGLHFPLDVFAGIAVGGLSAFALAPRPRAAAPTALPRWFPGAPLAAATVPTATPRSTPMTGTSLEVSVLIPAKDEADNIGPLVAEIAAALNPHIGFEVVLVDDGSRDATGEVFLDQCRRSGVRGQLLRHEHSCGQSTALLTAARHANGRFLVTIDGDGQNDPADIPALIAEARRLLSGGPDFCVAGHRRHRQDTRWKKLQSRIANAVRRCVLDDGVPDTGCGLKLIPRQTWLSLPYFDHMHRFLPALVQRIGGRVAVVPVNHRPRRAGISKYTAWNRLWVGLVDMVGVRWLMRRSQRPTLSDKQTVGEPAP
ncbi:glycosyltransferase [Hydrogenophaga sp. T2]|uniref:glycosyltransferase n=1 Tax=Hydrogenophaga sp. T2 TaxID=3132823 RepID=UPI003CED888F